MMFVWIPVFPLAGALLNGLVGIRYFPKRVVQAVAVGAAGLSFAASIASFVRLLGSGNAAVVKSLYTWIPANLVGVSGVGLRPLAIGFAFRYDALAAVMTLVVTGVGLLIHIYSVGYMAHDRSIARFFAYLNLFTFAMLILVLGANLAEGLSQERIQGHPMGHPKVAQGVGVHMHPPADPAISVVGFAEPGEFPGTAHPVARGVEPEGKENPRVDGRAAGPAFHGRDGRVEGREVQAPDG